MTVLMNWQQRRRRQQSKICLRSWNDNGCVSRWSRINNGSKWTSLTKEVAVCLQAQGIDNDKWVVGRVRQARGISNNDGGVRWGCGIDDASMELETTTEAARIWGRLQRLRLRYYRPEKLVTMTQMVAEEDEPQVSTTTTEASAEEAEEKMRPSERLRRRRRRCVYGLRVLTTTTTASA